MEHPTGASPTPPAELAALPATTDDQYTPGDRVIQQQEEEADKRIDDLGQPFTRVGMRLVSHRRGYARQPP